MSAMKGVEVVICEINEEGVIKTAKEIENLGPSPLL